MEDKNTWQEELKVTGENLVKKVKELVAQGNVRKLIIRKGNGDKVMEIPLTQGAVIGGAAVMLAPFLAGLTAVAALAVDLKIQVIRIDEEEDQSSDSSDAQK